MVTFSSMIALAVIFGTSYSFGAFFSALSETFSAQRADIAMMFGLAGFLYFAAGAAAGIAAVKFGPRLVSTLGMLLLGFGAMSASQADSIQQIYWSYGLGIGLGVALVYTPVMGAVPPWFTSQRSLASGLASAGIGIGTLVVPPLVSLGIEQWQWRDTMFYLGCGSMVVGLAASSQIGMPDQEKTQAGHRNGLSLAEALRSKPFWLLFGICAIAGPSLFFPFAHLIQFARDQGIAEVQAASTIGFIGIGSIAGRFFIGFFADRYGRLATMGASNAMLAGSLLLWFSDPGWIGLCLFALWFGIAYGSVVALFPPLCMDFFGARSVTGVLGLVYSGAGIGNLLGPVGAGALFDRYGNYHASVAIAIACALIAVLLSLAMMRWKRIHQPTMY
ncbi:MAG: MFS transporter [Betaproteobacteria bacterium]|nr:MFS transporter [Betaproteobacteria bacterium]